MRRGCKHPEVGKHATISQISMQAVDTSQCKSLPNVGHKQGQATQSMHCAYKRSARGIGWCKEMDQ
eukprot:366096-Pelagomonas_calceolata.AAC.2